MSLPIAPSISLATISRTSKPQGPSLKVLFETLPRMGFEVENPITHARAKFELDQHASPAVKALAGELAALRGKLDDMQQQIAFNRELASVQLGIPS
ncbi:MAG: hypothetical protein JO141_22055 [Bradyrhizobium sp.]|nr:hypothetical protein [Bradyrhizobium sp.]